MTSYPDRGLLSPDPGGLDLNPARAGPRDHSFPEEAVDIRPMRLQGGPGQGPQEGVGAAMPIGEDAKKVGGRSREQLGGQQLEMANRGISVESQRNPGSFGELGGHTLLSPGKGSGPL